MPRLRFLVVLLLAAALVLGNATFARAQVPPYTAYGTGLPRGVTVSASIDGVECGRAAVSAAGHWKLTIPAEAPCQPKEGATLRFAVDGEERPATARWSGGGAPLNPRVGIALAPAAAGTAASPTATVVPRATASATAPATPIAPATPAATPAATPVKKATPKPTATPRPKPTAPPWPWLARPSR